MFTDVILGTVSLDTTASYNLNLRNEVWSWTQVKAIKVPWGKTESYRADVSQVRDINRVRKLAAWSVKDSSCFWLTIF